MEYRKAPHVGQSDRRDTWNGKGRKKRQRRRVKEPPPPHPPRTHDRRHPRGHVARRAPTEDGEYPAGGPGHNHRSHRHRNGPLAERQNNQGTVEGRSKAHDSGR